MISIWRTPFTGVVVKDFLSFCFPENTLISPYYWRMILPDLGFLFATFFIQWLECISPTAFWLPKISVEKSTDNLVGDPFSLDDFEIHSLSLPLNSLIIMCRTVGLKGYPAWSSLRYLGVYIRVFHQIWNVFLRWILLEIFFFTSEIGLFRCSIFYSTYYLLLFPFCLGNFFSSTCVAIWTCFRQLF